MSEEKKQEGDEAFQVIPYITRAGCAIEGRRPLMDDQEVIDNLVKIKEAIAAFKGNALSSSVSGILEEMLDHMVMMAARDSQCIQEYYGRMITIDDDTGDQLKTEMYKIDGATSVEEAYEKAPLGARKLMQAMAEGKEQNTEARSQEQEEVRKPPPPPPPPPTNVMRESDTEPQEPK